MILLSVMDTNSMELMGGKGGSASGAADVIVHTIELCGYKAFVTIYITYCNAGSDRPPLQQNCVPWKIKSNNLVEWVNTSNKGIHYILAGILFILQWLSCWACWPKFPCKRLKKPVRWSSFLVLFKIYLFDVWSCNIQQEAHWSRLHFS